jgi:RNA polymerase II-associated factor 1
MLRYISTAIQAPLHPPAPNPHDRALLRPLTSLGKPKFADTGVSFLRRTEYISAYTSKSRFDSTTSKSLINNVGPRFQKPRVDVDRESPEYIKSQVEKSFDIAAAHLADKSKTRHPSKRNLKLVESYPIIPDLNAFTDIGAYLSIKFNVNPVPPSHTFDTRLESAILRPMDHTEEEQATIEAAQTLHAQDPERHPAPPDIMNYELYLTDSAQSSKNLKRKFNPNDPEHNSDELYSHRRENGEGNFRMSRVRAYETASSVGEVENKYDEEVVLSIPNKSPDDKSKAVYYYPIASRIIIRPQRAKNIRMGRMDFVEEENSVEYLELSIREPEEDEKMVRDEFREHPYGALVVEEEAAEADTGAAGDQDREGQRGSPNPQMYTPARSTHDDEDAEGESDD